MPQVSLDQIPENARLTIDRVKELTGLCRGELFKQRDTGELTWALGPRTGQRGPKLTTVVDARSLPPEDKKRFLATLAAERMASSRFFNSSEPASAGSPPEQADLFLSPVTNRMPGEYEQKRIAERRLRLIEPIANGLYLRMGYATKHAYIKATAHANQVSMGSLQRWWDDYREAGGGVPGLLALMNDKRGPEATGPRLEPWQKLWLDTKRLVDKSTFERAFEELLAETAARQASWGVAHIYQQPTRGAARRYWAMIGESAPAAAALEGRSALKAAAMQIHRTYTDCCSLDRVGVDEWITDVFTYNPDELLYRAGSQKGRARVSRYNYLITMLDERSLYPLDAVLVEFPDQEAEIDLLVRVCLDYGVPGLINSDRGRFRGRTFGGRFREFDRDAARGRIQGILDQLNIARNMPREHNPQGNRLERFHLEYARFCRTLPGWCGANPEEKDERSNAEADLVAHDAWVRGKAPATPLLSQDELLEKIRKFFAWWRNDHHSEGTDMNGLTPQIVFDRERPPQGFRRISAEELDRATARVYPDQLIKTGGIVDIPEGNYRVTRYYSHELLLVQGQRCTVTRSRYDRSKITVHGSGPGDPAILAPVMPRVGVSDPELLSQAIAEKTFSRHLLEAAVSQPSKPVLEISSTEVMMRRGRPPALDRIAPPRSVERLKTSEEVALEALAMMGQEASQ